MADFSDVKNVYDSEEKVMGTLDFHEDRKTRDQILEGEYLNPNFKSKILFGTFMEEKLILCLGIYFWRTFPSCTFVRLASLKGALPGRTIKFALRSMYSACLDNIESSGCNRFYAISPLDQYVKMAKIGNSYERVYSKYLVTVEEIIPAQTKPSFEYIWDMMGNRCWTVPLIVRAGTLLNEFRKFDTSLEELESL